MSVGGLSGNGMEILATPATEKDWRVLIGKQVTSLAPLFARYTCATTSITYDPNATTAI